MTDSTDMYGKLERITQTQQFGDKTLMLIVKKMLKNKFKEDFLPKLTKFMKSIHKMVYGPLVLLFVWICCNLANNYLGFHYGNNNNFLICVP